MKSSLKINYFFNLSYQIINIIIPVIVTPYISRVLQVENIGLVSIINANVAFFVLIGVFGFNTYAQIQLSKHRDNFDKFSKKCSEVLVARIFTMSFSIFIYVILYIHVFNDLSTFYIIMLPYLVANGIDVAWIYQCQERFIVLSIRNSSIKLLSLVLIFIFVKCINDTWIYLFITSTSLFLSNIIIIPGALKFIDFKNVNIKNVIKHLIQSSAYFLPAVASVIITTTDKIMLGYLSSDTIENGYYEQAYKFESILCTIFTSLNITLRPRMSYLYNNNGNEKAKNILKHSLSYILFLSLPICAGVVIISYRFVPLFFGAGYDGVIILLKIMSIWLIFKTISNCLLEQVVVPNGGQMKVNKLICFTAVLNIFLNYLFIPMYMSKGAALASLITELVVLLFALFLSFNEFKATFPKRDFVKEIISVIVMVCTIRYFDSVVDAGIFQLCLIVLLGIFVYFFISYILKNSFLYYILNIILKKLKLFKIITYKK